MRAEVPSAFCLSGPECRSGCARVWSWMNSLRRMVGSMAKRPVGGGPSGRVLGKRE